MDEEKDTKYREKIIDSERDEPKTQVINLKTSRRSTMAEVMLNGNLIHTGNQLPKIDFPAPDFKLADTDLVPRSLRDYGKKRKMLSFVPSLDTSVCSLETKKFNDLIASYPQHVVLIISADLPFAQKRWCGFEKVTNVIPLSMMYNKDAAASYGVLIQDGPLVGLAARSVFILDENNKLIYFELVPDIVQEPNYTKAMAVLTGS
jgi:thiol peroxidase